LNFQPPPYKQHRGFNKSTNNTIWTFRQVLLLQGLNSAKNIGFGQEIDNFFLWGEHPLQCCLTPNSEQGVKNQRTRKKNPNGGDGRRKQKEGFSLGGNWIHLPLLNSFGSIGWQLKWI
jgi:hypothetical protein